MATAWSVILREATKHANAFASGNAANTSVDYLTSPLTTTQVTDPYFNLDFIKDACIDAQGRLAEEIANVQGHPWRAYIGNSATGALATGAVIPLVAANSKSIIGKLGQVLSSDGSRMFSEAAPERVQSYLRDQTSYNDPDLYYTDGNKIYHTAAISVAITCCTYERADAVAAVAANGNITLPDVLTDAIVAGAVASLVVEGKGIEQAAYFRSYFEGAITSIRQGMTTVPMMKAAA